MIENNKKKKAWLDYLFYKVGKQVFDFSLNALRKKDGEVISSKWKKYSELCFPVDIGKEWKLNNINNRQIFPNEIVVDIENRDRYNEVVEKIKHDGLAFYAYDAGSKGIHIHIFCRKALSEEQKKFLIKKYCGDILKAYSKSTIALEFAKHWKSGKIKEVIERWKK